MKNLLLHIILFIGLVPLLHSQSNGVVAFDLPARNSLKFNRYAINPTFSFVREDNKYISLNNKRQWTQFNDNPETYLFSFAGRFKENTGMGIGLFQQNFGVMTTFGGALNYAYNVTLSRESNLTFGINAGFYQSKINDGKVITNFPDPSLNNFESNSLITVNPGINLGTGKFDFGLAINNAVLYNLQASEMVEDNPEQSFQAHAMFTGLLEGNGFFGQSKFSTLFITDFKTDNTVVSGLLMLDVPKGIWAQAGYNSVYGLTAGLGINITDQIAIEYNYEKAVGELSTFGNSHDITLAYRFKKTVRYLYNDEEEEQALLSPSNNRTRTTRRSKAKPVKATPNEAVAERRARIEAERIAAQAKQDSINLVESKAKEIADLKIKEQEELARKQAEEDAKIKAQQEAEELAAKEEEARLKAEADKKAREEEAARLIAEREKLAEEARVKAESDRLALEAEEKAKEQARIEAEKAAQLAAEKERERLRLEEIARTEAEEKAKEEARLEAEKAAQLAAEQERERLRLEEVARLEAEEKAKQEARLEAERAAQLAEEQEREKERIAEEERKRLEAEAEKERERLRQEELARKEAEERAKAEAEKLAQEKAKLEAETKDNQIQNDPTAKAIETLSSVTENNEAGLSDLLNQLEEKVAIKRQDLSDLKEENDLGDQGIFVDPKPFKSVTAENNLINALKIQLDASIKSQRERITELEKLFSERLKKVPSRTDEINLKYQYEISKLKMNQRQAIQARDRINADLEEIAAATEIERKRRIERAAYDNETDRYNKDRATLKYLVENTPLSSQPISEDDFDFGDTRNDIQILKNVQNIESGYYMVIAVHTNTQQRDDFLTKVIASGRKDVNFFYDVNTSKYYIYYEKFNTIRNAEEALRQKGNRPYNGKMSMVKIEN